MNEEDKTFSPVPRKRLSIYHEEEVKDEVVEQPYQLELQIRSLRHSVTEFFKETNTAIQGYVNSWIQIEKAVKDSTTEYFSEHDRLLPGALYIMIAGFGGSILTKNKKLPTRLFTPILFSTSAFIFFYPEATKKLVTKNDVSKEVFNLAAVGVANLKVYREKL
ncbi:hypothetical protein HK099_002098, partial [Clydaea vesicula]